MSSVKRSAASCRSQVSLSALVAGLSTSQSSGQADAPLTTAART